MPLYPPASGGSGAGSWDAVITKANTDTVTNSATPAADSELTFPVVAGLYEIEFTLFHECTSLANFKWHFEFPAIDNVNLCIGSHTTYSTGGSITHTVAPAGSVTNWPTSGGVVTGQPATNKRIPIYGKLTVTMAASGTLSVKFAQGTATAAQSVLLRPGSSLRYKKLA